MSRLTDLLRRLENQDAALAQELRREYERLSERRAFGLNFERHVPETVELPGRAIRRGDKVRFRAPRGESVTGIDDRLWLVTRLTTTGAERIAHLVEYRSNDEPEAATRKAEDLVVVAEFRDPIFPGLRSTGKVERGGDKPFHTVINGENHHALEALLFAYEGKIDCIYIDPPYNTGAPDWKYNNNYVDSDDAYRHSKWLAMMERRLKLAKRLLNPDDSVLIVTIDEKEYLRLGLLLEQTFPAARIQMISTLINPAAVARTNEFGRSDEYYFFVMRGVAGPKAQDLSDGWITTTGRTHRGEIRWDLLRRSGTNTQRERSPGTFYPFFLHEDSSRIHSIGEALPLSEPRDTVVPPSGTVAVWPMRRNGTEGVWQLSPSKAREVWQAGFMKTGRFRGQDTAIYYLKPGERGKIESGIYKIIGHNPDGSVITSTIEASATRMAVPGTQWRIPSHDSSQYGSRLLGNLMPDRKFPFPKSLYAVEDALRFFVSDKPDAVILDFFAGSGTTAHAVMRLNRQDGGRRRSILVTNNEVSAEEEQALRKAGHRPGDPEWEALGICEYITKPRIRAAITGDTPEGEPIKGNYRFTDEFPMADGFEENAEFFDLTYEDPERVRFDLAFSVIAPLLWIRAGSEGRRIDCRADTFDIADTYGVLFDVDAAAGFLDAMRACGGLRIAYIVTDDERQFQVIARELPEGVEPVRLYESYLSTFRINLGD